MQSTVSLSEVLGNLKLSNNGYVFASSLSSEYIRRSEQLVKRNVILKDTLRKGDGTLEVAYFISYKAWGCALQHESIMERDHIDYESKILASTEHYLSEC